MWIAVLLACQEPFSVDRHDLVGFRIAAVTAEPTASGSILRPSAAIIVDGRPWAARPADLSWYWVEDADAVTQLDPLSEAAGVGPDPELERPADERALALIARHDGEEARAILEVPGPPATLPSLSRLQRGTLELALDTVGGPQLTLEARRALQPDEQAQLEPGGFVRLSAELQGEAQGTLIRWMATAGTFLELDAHTTDWAAGQVQLDEDELAAPPEPLAPGHVTVIALLLGPPGEARFHATELAVGPPGDGLWVEGRWLPTDAPIAWSPGDAVRGTLIADDASPVGLRLIDAQPEPADAVTDWGTPTLACLVSRDGPFDPGWLLTQICGRDGADGRSVVVVPGSEP